MRAVRLLGGLGMTGGTKCRKVPWLSALMTDKANKCGIAFCKSTEKCERVRRDETMLLTRQTG